MNGEFSFPFYPGLFKASYRRRSRGGGGGLGSRSPQTKIGAAGAEKHFYGCI